MEKCVLPDQLASSCWLLLGQNQSKRTTGSLSTMLLTDIWFNIILYVQMFFLSDTKHEQICLTIVTCSYSFTAWLWWFLFVAFQTCFASREFAECPLVDKLCSVVEVFPSFFLFIGCYKYLIPVKQQIVTSQANFIYKCLKNGKCCT